MDWRQMVTLMIKKPEEPEIVTINNIPLIK
jgi:hypothetical protein